MSLVEMQPFAASTTVLLANDVLTVVKRRIPVCMPGSPDHARSARRRAEQATVDEASWLGAARHRSVVRLVRADPAALTLETAYAGRRSMRTAALTPDQAAAALAALASALHELHDEGMAHGHLTLDHLIVGPEGPRQIMLCSPRGNGFGIDRDLLAVVAIADQLRARLAPRSAVWARTIDNLRSDPSARDARSLGRTFEELGRRRRRPLDRIRSPGWNT